MYIYGLYSYGLDSYGLYSYGLDSYGLLMDGREYERRESRRDSGRVARGNVCHGQLDAVRLARHNTCAAKPKAPSVFTAPKQTSPRRLQCSQRRNRQAQGAFSVHDAETDTATELPPGKKGCRAKCGLQSRGTVALCTPS